MHLRHLHKLSEGELEMRPGYRWRLAESALEGWLGRRFVRCFRLRACGCQPPSTTGRWPLWRQTSWSGP